MKRIIEKSKISIDNKIFTKEDINSLIKLFNKLTREIFNKSNETKKQELIKMGGEASSLAEPDFDFGTSTLEFTFSDRSTYAGSLDQTLDENTIFGKKKITGIDLNFKENVSECRISVRINHSDSSSNYVLVEGQDTAWVDETIGMVKDILSSCRNQSTFVRKYHLIIVTLTILFLDFFLLNLIKLFIKIRIIFPRIVDAWFTKDLIFFLLVITLMTITPSLYIYGWLSKLYPRVEIQFGNNYQKAVRAKRIKLFGIISLILIPAVVSYLLRLL
jgi:hypothetical protein